MQVGVAALPLTYDLAPWGLVSSYLCNLHNRAPVWKPRKTRARQGWQWYSLSCLLSLSSPAWLLEPLSFKWYDTCTQSPWKLFCTGKCTIKVHDYQLLLHLPAPTLPQGFSVGHPDPMLCCLRQCLLHMPSGASHPAWMKATFPWSHPFLATRTMKPICLVDSYYSSSDWYYFKWLLLPGVLTV